MVIKKIQRRQKHVKMEWLYSHTIFEGVFENKHMVIDKIQTIVKCKVKFSLLYEYTRIYTYTHTCIWLYRLYICLM